MSHYYIIDEHGSVVEADSVLEWSNWFEDSTNRQLARWEHGDIAVSTVFLGIDHSFGYGPPVLWETLVFNGARDGEMERYTSRADALAGHERWVAKVKGDTDE